MRRFVRDRIADALEPARPALEEYISRHPEYPLGFPYKFAPAVVVIREVRQLKVVPLARADLPAVRVEAVVKAWLFARESRVRTAGDPESSTLISN